MSETLERTRTKYQSRLKRLEQRILGPMIQQQLGLDTSFHAMSSSVRSEEETDDEEEEGDQDRKL